MRIKSELFYLKDALEQNDDYCHIAYCLHSEGYRDSAVGLAKLPVPAELAVDDLLLINS